MEATKWERERREKRRKECKGEWRERRKESDRESLNNGKTEKESKEKRIEGNRTLRGE